MFKTTQHFEGECDGVYSFHSATTNPKYILHFYGELNGAVASVGFEEGNKFYPYQSDWVAIDRSMSVTVTTGYRAGVSISIEGSTPQTNFSVKMLAL